MVIPAGKPEKIVLKWHPKSGFYFTPATARIVFADDGSEIPLSPQISGRALGETLDTKLASLWLKICEEHHCPECSPVQGVIATPTVPEGLNSLHVIDVQNHCVVTAVPGCRYLALSYVWGPVQNVLLLKENKSQLMTPGGPQETDGPAQDNCRCHKFSVLYG
ncbi:hypothetical protein F5884DRAFT_781159, partial [Xylogone sp. PMI_703]